MGFNTIVLIGGAQSKELERVLRYHYNVLFAPSGKQAAELARQNSPQIVIIDASAMRNNGERVCRSLQRELTSASIIHIHPGPEANANSDADLVLFPPVSPRKLQNNVKRLLNRNNTGGIICGPFSLNESGRILRANGKETSLTPKELALIKLFFQHPNKTIDRQQIMEQVWNTDYMGDTRTLNVHIRWLRQALEEDASRPRYLVTVRGEGYRLEIPGQHK